MNKVSVTSTSTKVTVETPPKPGVSLLTQPASIRVSPGGNRVNVTTGLQGPPGIGVDQSFEVTSKNLKAYPAALTWTNGQLTSMEYSLGGGLSVTKTLNYSGGQLDSIVLSGDTPGGINLTKSLTWVNGTLTEVSYS